MFRLRCWCVTIIFVLTVVASAQAASQVASKYIEEVEAKAEAVKSYEADVAITMVTGEEKLSMAGTIKYKMPKKMRMEILLSGKKPMRQITVSDGKVLWQYLPEAKVAKKYNLKEGIARGMISESGGIHSPFKDMEPDTIKFIGKKALYGQRTWLFEGEPSASLKAQYPESFIKMAVWVDPKNGLVRRVVIYDEQNRESMVQEYRRIKTNIFLRNTIFEFTPPPGVKVEEPFLKK